MLISLQDVGGELFQLYDEVPEHEFLFYIPQLCTFLLHGNYEKNVQLECFLLDRAERYVAFVNGCDLGVMPSFQLPLLCPPSTLVYGELRQSPQLHQRVVWCSGWQWPLEAGHPAVCD